MRGPESEAGPAADPAPLPQHGRGSGKSRLRRWCELQAGYGLPGWALARREQRPGRPAGSVAQLPPVPAFVIEGEAPDAPFLVSTAAGLFLWRDGGFQALLAGRLFGVAVAPGGEAAFVFQQTGRFGRIVELRGLSGRPQAATRVWGLSRWIHQIDLIGTQLAVLDTDRNRLLFFDMSGDGGPVHASGTARTGFVDGDARSSRQSPNYHHVNSVLRRGDRLYVMAHNHSVRTGRLSEIYVLDESLSVLDVLPADGRCCHNVCFADGAALWCRSREGTLARDGVDVVKTDGFTRGLAVNQDTVLLGVTPFVPDRADRDRRPAAIEVCSRDFTRRGRITLATGQIREIRFLHGDLGLSNTPG